MALDMFLDIKGEIAGEAQDSKHKDEIDVLAWAATAGVIRPMPWRRTSPGLSRILVGARRFAVSNPAARSKDSRYIHFLPMTGAWT